MDLVFDVRTLIARSVIGAVILGSLLPGAALAADWPTFHGDNSRAGVDAAENSVIAIRQAWQSTPLDGKVYASPVALGSQVLVATENNTVYSFDQASGRLNWQHQVAPPYQGGLPCGNLGPPMGITSTPVIDPATGYVYVVALVGGPDYVLYALNVNAGGAEVFHRGVNPGDPAHFDAGHQGQRPALALANGYVYIAYGGRDGDCEPYHGWVVGAPAAGPSGALAVWHSNFNNQEVGLWGTSGPAIDASGNVIVATGNASGSGCPGGPGYDDSNSVIKLSPTLAPVDYWAPSNWHALSCSDTDIGSLGPTILPNGSIFQSGKAGVSYLLPGTGLGGIGGNNDGNGFQMSNCSGAFGGAAAIGNLVFVPCPFSHSIIALNANGSSLSEAWHETAAGGIPTIAGGYVWSIGGGQLHGFNSINGNAAYSLPVEGHSTSFPAIAAANGKLYYAGDAHLTAFQLTETLAGHGPGNPDAGRPWTGGSDAVGLTSGGLDAYFAEGNTGDNVHEYITVSNLSGAPQSLTVDYLLSGGAAPVSTAYPLPAIGRLTIDVNHDIGPGQDVSVHLHAAGRFMAERPMYFNLGGRTGGHVGVGAQSLAQHFYFAEGHTGDGVDEYLTFMNTNPAQANASVTLLTPGGALAPFAVAVPGNGRVTIHVNDRVANADLSAQVDSDLPILVERPMYFNLGGITGGHVAVGATRLLRDVSLAEGHTGDGFTQYVTVANPNPVPANITIFYYLPDGQVVPKAFQVGPQSRLTTLVNGYLPRSDQSLRVTSDQPIAVERPMYFVYGGVWDGGHDALAVDTTTLGSTYYFAEGDPAPNIDEWITILNRNSSAVSVHIAFNDSNGTPYSADLVVGANSRGTFKANSIVPPNTPVTATVFAAGGAAILVERSMYFAY